MIRIRYIEKESTREDPTNALVALRKSLRRGLHPNQALRDTLRLYHRPSYGVGGRPHLWVAHCETDGDNGWLLEILDMDNLEIPDLETLRRFIQSNARSLTELAVGVPQ